MVHRLGVSGYEEPREGLTRGGGGGIASLGRVWPIAGNVGIIYIYIYYPVLHM